MGSPFDFEERLVLANLISCLRESANLPAGQTGRNMPCLYGKSTPPIKEHLLVFLPRPTEALLGRSASDPYKSLGARNFRQARQVFRVCITLALGLGLVLCGLLMCFHIQLLGIYVKPTDAAYEAVMAAGMVRVMAISRFQWVGGLMEAACGALRGMGKSLNPTITTLAGACLLRVVWIYTVFAYFGTVQSLYWSYPISWVLTFAAHCLFLFWRLIRSSRFRLWSAVLYSPPSPVFPSLCCFCCWQHCRLYCC